MAHTSVINTERPRQRTGLVGPVVLIGLGVLLLLNNIGMVGWGVWGALLRFWPVLLIAVGLDILIGRRSVWISALIALGALLALAALVNSWGGWSGAITTLTDTAISQSLDGATRASVEIAPGVGVVRISAMDEPDGLMRGTVQTYSNERLDRTFTIHDGTGFFTLRSNQVAPWEPTTSYGERRWDLRLNPAIPTRLTISSGVGKTDADLSGLNLMGLTINTGVGEMAVTLPATGRFEAQISGGVGDTVVQIPAGLAARITINGGLGQTRVIGRYDRDGDTYTAPGYATAAHRVDLTIDGGVGSVTVR